MSKPKFTPGPWRVGKSIYQSQARVVAEKGKGRKMKTKDFLKKHEACYGGAKWALSISKEMSDWPKSLNQ